MSKKQKVSPCCHAEVKVVRTGTTMFYACTSCKQSCDPVYLHPKHIKPIENKKVLW